MNLFDISGFPNPWDIILNKRRFEYAMVRSCYDAKRKENIFVADLEIQRIR